ncbi:MAG: nucleoside triphosphate pyrophosphohydrolase [Nanobdellota archaeon]
MKNDKLVRDNIPEIIKNEGKVPKTHKAPDDEYKHKLKAKLKEEVDEFLEEPKGEELADILEVVYALRDFYQIKDLEKLRKEKAEERGSFREKIVLDGLQGD